LAGRGDSPQRTCHVLVATKPASVIPERVVYHIARAKLPQARHFGEANVIARSADGLK